MGIRYIRIIHFLNTALEQRNFEQKDTIICFVFLSCWLLTSVSCKQRKKREWVFVIAIWTVFKCNHFILNILSLSINPSSFLNSLRYLFNILWTIPKENVHFKQRRKCVWICNPKLISWPQSLTLDFVFLLIFFFLFSFSASPYIVKWWANSSIRLGIPENKHLSGKQSSRRNSKLLRNTDLLSNFLLYPPNISNVRPRMASSFVFQGLPHYWNGCTMLNIWQINSIVVSCSTQFQRIMMSRTTTLLIHYPSLVNFWINFWLLLCNLSTALSHNICTVSTKGLSTLFKCSFPAGTIHTEKRTLSAYINVKWLVPLTMTKLGSPSRI